MDTRILCVRHGDGPTDDRVTLWCAENSVTADIRRPWRGDTLGEITEDLIGVVIYGGMYNAYDTDKHPFLTEEYRMIDAAMRADVPLLGICQGAQMIALHLGAWVGAPDHGLHEFGYYEVSPTPAGQDILPEPLHMCQAHFHTFDLPGGATHLARSATFEHQAFRYGERVMAFQFHAEQTIAGFQRWQAQRHRSDPGPERGVQPVTLQNTLAQRHDPAMGSWFLGVLDRFFGANPA